jgi:hypothetical protein
MRKIQPLFISLALVACVYSCQSEYSQRLSKGFELKKELIRLSNTPEVSNQLKVKEIKKELHLHAQVSGNEELFFEQLGLK